MRELENIVERAMILVKGERLEASDLDFGRRAQVGGAVPQPISTRVKTEPLTNVPGSGPTAAPPAPAGDAHPPSDNRPLSERLADEERREIISAVDKSGNNIALAARMLGINRSTLYYRMRKHGLEHLLPTKTTVGLSGGPVELAVSVSGSGSEPE